MNTLRNLCLILAATGVLAAVPAHGADLWDVYQLALKNDPTYQQAQANYQAALENKPIARAGYLPNLSLNASKSWSTTYGTSLTQTGTTPSGQPILGNVYNSTPGRDTQYGLQLTQPLFNWAAWENIKQADASVAQAEAQFLAAQQDLIVRTATAYFNVITARDTLSADRAATEANGKQLEQAQAQYKVGTVAITNVEQAQAAYDQSVATEIGQRQQVINAEESLRAITGEAVSSLQEPSPDMPLRSPDPANAKQWVDTALQQNPNLMAAQAAAEIAADAVSVKRAGHMPTLGLTASYGRDNATGTIFNTFRTNQKQLMLNFSMPLFSGGGVTAQVTQAERQYDAAQANAQLANRQTVQQARTAYLGVLTGISQVQALRQSVKSNQTSLQATETGLRVGTQTIVNVLLAVQNLATAQTSFAQSRDNYLISVLTLKQAAGILNPQDLKQINALLVVPAPSSGMSTLESAPAAGTSLLPPGAGN
ncbi:MAG: TolC family outer membrane protein [Gammaproteobacteria bacterium]|nr:TolC family outer membrane protein [Gammaproteobacteria bacterium]MDE2108677.1 TolC family outer membrane protein [Gammaproteobacteria bacterium]